MQLLRALATKSGLGGRFIALVVALLGGCGGGGGGGTASIDPFQLFTSVAVADLDGDGLPDIAATYAWVAGPPPHSGYVAVYLQDRARPGNFLPAAVYAVGNDPVSIAIGDLDADGKADMVTADTITHADGVGSSTVSVLRQDPTRSGRYLPAVAYATGFSPTSVALGDLNADGKPDLAVADRGGISLLFQNPATPGTFQSRSVLAVGATYSVSIGDVDGDGKPDLVGTQASQDQVLVLLQDRQVAGTFLSPARYVAGAQPVHTALADLDGDRRPDIALANLGAPADPGSASASVLLQDPATPGDFRGAVDYATANRSSAVAIADLNGDTRADLAVANAGSLSGLCPPDCDSAGAGVSVLLQDPAVAGRYLPATNYPTSDGEYGAWVAVADLNGDGRADLVIAQSNGIFIRLQDPMRAGQFQAAVPVSN